LWGPEEAKNLAGKVAPPDSNPFWMMVKFRL
jgi:hypothetical protein